MNSAALTAAREIATKTTAYSHTLRFTRRFTSGSLAGLTHDDAIGFCSAADCDEWVSAVNRRNKAGEVDYLVESWRIEAAPVTLRIGRLSFQVTVVDGKVDCDRPVYELTGVRGAKYRTMRNVHRGWMFLIGGRDGFGSTMKGIRLSDDSGTLVVVR